MLQFSVESSASPSVLQIDDRFAVLCTVIASTRKQVCSHWHCNWLCFAVTVSTAIDIQRWTLTFLLIITSFLCLPTFLHSSLSFSLPFTIYSSFFLRSLFSSSPYISLIPPPVIFPTFSSSSSYLLGMQTWALHPITSTSLPTPTQWISFSQSVKGCLCVW